MPAVPVGVPFKAILVIRSRPSEVWQDLLSAWLVASGGLYMMAWGEDCSSWDDSVDWAAIDAHADGTLPEDQVVMTTWHETESLKDVMRFAKTAAKHPDVPLAHVVIFEIGDDTGKADLTALFKTA